MISRHYRVRGRVQGVGFRYFVVDEATRLGVVGWVRNCPDGSVEVEATAPMLSLASLREALARGPRGARVDGVEELELEAPAVTAGRFMIMR